jgi:hypothetical protein
MQYINPTEAIKRLAASQGIDVLNLVKTEQQVSEEEQQLQQQAAQQSLMDQAGQMAAAPVMDPTKNESLGQQLGNNETIPPEEG